jgi:hypothetical protein
MCDIAAECPPLVMTAETFQLYAYMFAKSVEMKIILLWHKNADCFACWANWFSPRRNVDEPAELNCNHTDAEPIEKYFTEVISGEEYFFTLMVLHASELEGWDVPNEDQIDNLKNYCKTIYKPEIKRMILGNYAGVPKKFKEYFV